MATYNIWTIGCQMNTSDARKLSEELEEQGFTETEKARSAEERPFAEKRLSRAADRVELAERGLEEARAERRSFDEAAG